MLLNPQKQYYCVSCHIKDWLVLLSNLKNSIFDSCVCPASDKRGQFCHPVFEFLFWKNLTFNFKDSKSKSTKLSLSKYCKILNHYLRLCSFNCIVSSFLYGDVLKSKSDCKKKK